MICDFITEHKRRFGVYPICHALTTHGVKIAPSTYYAHLKRAPSKRALSDLVLVGVLAELYEPWVDERGRKRRHPESLYGTVKMWAHLNQVGVPVAKCTVARLKQLNRWEGVRRAKRIRTTVSDPNAARPADLVDRDFTAEAPNELVVADFTYVRLACGQFAYTAFVIDAFAGLIPGWECSLVHNTAFVERALRQATSYRARVGDPMSGSTIHHNDAGSEYAAVHFGEQLFLEGLLPSVGSIADAFDNALAETTIGLYKTEAIRVDSPFRLGPIQTLADLEQVTSAWVHWYNNHRLMHRIGLMSPARVEAKNYSEKRDHEPVAALK